MLSKQIVDVVQQEMQIHDNRLTMAIGRMRELDTTAASDDRQKQEYTAGTGEETGRSLPEESDSLPEEIGNVLERFE